MPEATDPLLEAVKESQANLKAQQLTHSLAFGLPQNPSENTRNSRIARVLAATPEQVKLDPQRMAAYAKLNGFDAEQAVADYPITTSIFSTPQTAASAHDDFETYKTVEDLFRSQNAIMLPPVAGAPSIPIMLGNSTWAKYLAPVVNAPYRVAASTGRALAGLGVLHGELAERFLSAYQKLLGPEFGAGVETPLKNVTESTGMLKRFAEASAMASSITQPTTTGGKVVDFTARLPLEMAKFANPAGIAILVAEGVGSGYVGARDTGASVEKALLASYLHGGLNAALGAVPGKPAQTFGGEVARRVARGGVLGSAMHAGSSAITATYSPEMAVQQFKDPAAWIESALSMTGFEVAGLLPHVVAARANYRFMQDVKTTVEASRMAKEDPVGFRVHLEQLTKGKEVGMPAERFVRFWQSMGEDPVAKASEMGIQADALNEALATKTDIKLKVSSVLDATVKDGTFDEFSKDLRLRPGIPTLSEAETVNQIFAANVKQAVADIKKMIYTETEHPDRETIYSRMLGQLQAVGGETAKTAEQNAKLFTNFAINFSARANEKSQVVTPTEIADRLIGVRRGEPGTSMAERVKQNASFRMVDTESPEFKNWFGQSKFVDQNGAPQMGFHGTYDEFTTFKDRAGKGFFFATDPGFSNFFNRGNAGRTVPVYLKMEKPFDFRNPEDVQAWAAHRQSVQEKITNADDVSALKWEYPEPEDVATGFWDYLEVPGFQRFLHTKGYDSYFVTENDSLNAAVFKPEQIKSAISNTGEFSLDNPSLLFQSLSSRLPTAKGATEDPLQNILLSGIEAMARDPKVLEKNAELVRTYPGVKISSKAKPETVAKQFIAHVKDNLLWLFDQTPKDIRDRAKLWYVGANRIAQEYAQKHSKEVSQVAGVFAVLSPQRGWFQNVSLGERVLTTLTEHSNEVWSNEMQAKVKSIPAMAKEKDLLAAVQGKTLSELADAKEKAFWIRAYDETYNDRAYKIVSPEGGFGEPAKTGKGENQKVAWGTLDQITKAVRVFEDATPKTISDALGTMHKVRNFYNNIFDPSSPDYTTIDTHAVAAGLLLPVGGNHEIVGQNFGGAGSASSSLTGSQGTYGLFQEAYKQAAEARGVLPREMQSITWEAVRGLFSPEFKRSPNGMADTEALWNEYKQGRASIDETRAKISELTGGISNPDWHTTTRLFQTVSEPTFNEGRISIESMPGSNVREGVAPGIESATPQTRELYHFAKMQIVEQALRDAGFQLAPSSTGHGYWDRESNLVTGFTIKLPDHLGTPEGRAELERAANVVARVVGDQDAVGWNGTADPKAPEAEHNALTAELSRALTKDEVLRLGGALQDSGLGAFLDAADLRNPRLVVYDPQGLTTAELHSKLRQVMETGGPADVESAVRTYKAESGLANGGTNENQGLGTGTTGSPDLQAGAVARGRSEIERLNDTYWGPERTGSWSRLPGAEGLPDAVEVGAVHYATQSGDRISTDFRNGSPSRETARLAGIDVAQNPELAPLLKSTQLYVSQRGELPRKEPLVKGTEPHGLRVGGILPIDNPTAEKLMTQARDLASNSTGAAADTLNQFERLVFENGYRGYKSGRVVKLIGHDSVGVTPLDQQGVRFYQSDGAPLWRSVLSESIPQMSKLASKTGEIDPVQAKAWLKSNGPKLGVKAEEVKWSGIEEWLDLQKEAKRKVSVQEIQDFLKQGGVQVQETMKGGTAKMPPELARYVNGGTTPQDAAGWIEQANMAERTAQQWQRQGNTAKAEEWFRLSEQMSQMAEDLETPSGGFDTTRYSDYQLPGGTDYRELLLTLPSTSTAPTPTRKQWTLTNPEGETLSVGDAVAADRWRSDPRYVDWQITERVVTDNQALRRQNASQGNFVSSHWDEPNILSHIRFNTRTDAEGKKVLFIEEIQSDWGQKGKKEGFIQTADMKRVAEIEAQLKELQPRISKAWDTSEALRESKALFEGTDEQKRWALRESLNAQSAYDKLEMERTQLRNEMFVLRNKNGIPSAPFVTDTKAWVALSLKRMIRYAADNGFDKIAFVNGEQSADRYDLSKSIEHLAWEKNEDGTYNIDAPVIGGSTISKEDLSLKEVEDLVGKEIAQKIQAGEGVQHPENGGYRDWRYIEGENLKVGGEGMRAFYDKIVPSVAREVLKKLGGGELGRVDLNTGDSTRNTYSLESVGDRHGIFKLGEDGPEGAPIKVFSDFSDAVDAIEAMNAKARNDSPQLSFDITPTLKSKALEGMALFQPTPSGDTARGYLDFIRQDGQPLRFEMGLLNDNKSTALHELGHFYLEMIKEVAGREGVSEQVKEDWGKIRDWLGAKDGEPLTTEQHEQFARGHEAYFREGNAPSEDLRGAFQRFSRWLSKIYKSADELNVPMTDEIRGVFDRLYATDTEIEAAKKITATEPMFATAADMGVSDREFKAYSKLAKDVITKAHERMLKSLMAQMHTQEKAEWREGLALKREEVAKELDADPAYIALKALTTGKAEDGTEVKLSRQALVDLYGEGILKELGRSTSPVYAKEGGMDPDAAALLLGFQDGNALIESIKGLEPRSKRIVREAEERMKAEHGDLMSDPAALQAKALEVMHNEGRAELLDQELKALNAKRRTIAPVASAAARQAAGEVRAASEAQSAAERLQARESASENVLARRSAAEGVPDQRVIRKAAENWVANQPLKDTEPYKYLVAQRRLAGEAIDLAAKGKYEEAYTAKAQELMNHFMFTEATKAKVRAEKLQDFAKHNQKPRVQGNLGKAEGTFQEQHNALLERFGLWDGNPVQRTEALAKWVETMEAQHEDTAIAPWLLNDGFTSDLRQLTNSQISDLHDALKNIKHLAYRQFNVIVDGKSYDFKQLKDDLIGAAVANLKVKPLDLPGTEKSLKEAVYDKLLGLDASLIKMEQFINWLDGNDINGPWHRAIWNPIAKAQTADLDLIVEINGKLMEALDQMPKAQQNSMADTFTVQGIKQPLSRQQLISMLFNMGTEKNKAKLIGGFEGYGFNEQTVADALSNLNKHDLVFVQGAWDTIGELWPKIAELQKKLTGVEPKREEAIPVTITMKDGTTETLRGGYYPLKAAPGRSSVAGKQESSGTALFDYGGGYAKASTSTGHTKERGDAVYELDMDFKSVLAQHTSQVIKDLTHREAVLLANRLLTHPEIRRTLQETLGPVQTDQFMPWLRNVVNDRNGRLADAASAWTMTALQTRSNLVAATLGMKYSTVIVQLTDALRVVGPGDYRVSADHFAKALTDYVAHPKQTAELVREMSGEMRHRPENLDRDLRALWDHLGTDGSWKARWNRKAFKGLAFMDALTSVPAWLGSYRQAVEKGSSHEDAVKIADRTVRMTLMSGAAKDLVGLQRSPDTFTKLVTMFMGDGTAQFNLLRNAGHKGLAGIPEFTAVAVMMSMANIIGDYLKGQKPAEGEDKRKWALRKALLAWSQPIPIMRDLANATDATLNGNPFGGDYRLSPVMGAAQKAINLVGKDLPAVLDGKQEYPDFAIHAFDTLGTLSGIGGTSQATASAKYLRRVQKGQEKPENLGELVYNTVTGKPPEMKR